MRTPLAKMVDKFQCPGCVLGSDTKCGNFRTQGRQCDAWAAGIRIFPVVGLIALGLPKGFNRIGEGKLYFNLYPVGGELQPKWDRLNVAVWAMELEGFLFVRTYSPRVNATRVDIIEGGKRAALVPDAIDVGEFIGEID